FDLDLDGVRLSAQSLDLDVTVEDDLALGSSFETALRVGRANVHRRRAREDGSFASDDDALCSIEGRVRVEPDALLIRRFQGIGSADLDPSTDVAPACDL